MKYYKKQNFLFLNLRLLGVNQLLKQKIKYNDNFTKIWPNTISGMDNI